MWEFWRSRGSKGRSRHRKQTDDDDSPGATRAAELPFSLGLTGNETGTQPPENSTHVYFKDIILAASDDSEDESEWSERESMQSEAGEGGVPRPRGRHRRQRVDKQKLVIILVGLPGRGKTFLCNKLLCYLNWLGHETRHFNVGQYRRKQKGEAEVQSAEFFDPANAAGMEARERALYAALDDLDHWLAQETSQVAIFDATNSTEERRGMLRQRFHGRKQYLFIESICNDTSVLEQNYRYKMMYSPDYVAHDPVQALADFRARISKYEAVYQTITDRNLHYIKLIDMVTGRGYMDVNRISGYIPGKMVFFLMQVCKSGVARLRKIWLTRHGESLYNEQALLGGDSPLSETGRAYARLLPDVIVDRIPLTCEGATMPVSVWTSTLKRTIQTAELLPFPKLRWKVLDEIQAGSFDGWTYERIERECPEEFQARKKDKLRYRYPAGESYMDVIQRLEPVIIEIERERECVCVVAHQAILRALYGYFTKTPLKDIPRLEIPLHTLIELVPKPDGKMAEERIVFDPANEIVKEAEARQRGASMDLSSAQSLLVEFPPLSALNSSFEPILAAVRESSAGPSRGISRSSSQMGLAKGPGPGGLRQRESIGGTHSNRDLRDAEELPSLEAAAARLAQVSQAQGRSKSEEAAERARRPTWPEYPSPSSSPAAQAAVARFMPCGQFPLGAREARRHSVDGGNKPGSSASVGGLEKGIDRAAALHSAASASTPLGLARGDSFPQGAATPVPRSPGPPPRPHPPGDMAPLRTKSAGGALFESVARVVSDAAGKLVPEAETQTNGDI